MVDNYNDFVKDLNRTEISNYERLNNDYVLIFQGEVSKIIRKISLGYVINFNIDYQNMKDKIVTNELFLMVSIFISSFFNDCVLNTILFQ